MNKVPFAAFFAILFLTGFSNDPSYKLPAKEIVEIFDAAPPPQTVVSPKRDAMLIVEPEGLPPISLLAQPILRIAGVRINPAIRARQRIVRFTGISVQSLDGTPPRRVNLPAGSRIGYPAWSHDGSRFAFTRDLPNGVELWVCDMAGAIARPVANVHVNDVLGTPFQWLGDGRHLIVLAVAEDKQDAPPPRARVPVGPVIDETTGKQSQMPTFEDLLKTPHDELLFEFYGRSQLLIVDTVSGNSSALGEPDLLFDAAGSPDDHFILVTRVRRPFSHRVPYLYFTRSIEVWDTTGKKVATVADFPVTDEVPRQGVPVGPRNVSWQPLVPATLVWSEALDGGDPLRGVPYRDRLMSLDAPFTGVARELVKVKGRISRVDWTALPSVALVSEFDRARRWTTTNLIDFAQPSATKVLFDHSINDDYNDPGHPIYDIRPSGERILLQDDNAIYLAGRGATESGDKPFLDKLELRTLQKKRLQNSEAAVYESFISFVKESRVEIVMRRESRSESPNFFLADLDTGQRKQLTFYQDPAPLLQRVRKQLIRYARPDGVALSGTLYLPPDYKPGTRLPALIWAYPLEYSDPDTASQVRSSPNRFTLPSGASPILLATQGYAVLMDATMPVVGDPETANNTYVEQISADARAAVNKLDDMGIADRSRIVIGGHSYGAFMTANLLAHTELFVAGIARSGAYNRSLTPFGFQRERRSFWEATDLYVKMSPFTYANRIKAPILLIHGEADNNAGTFPIQSERLFEAIRGNGGTARLVLLPHEAHNYLARESVLHVLAEMIEWADRWTGSRERAR
jgi:dipeptidyl aminopeptidase/acylaminoacyl peptidase